MKLQIMRVYTEQIIDGQIKQESFETIDRDCIKFYKKRGATIVKTGSYVVTNTCR